MIIILLAAQAAAAKIAPPEPRIYVPVPPPVYITTPAERFEPVRFSVYVDVRAAGEPLWSGPLRVGGGYGQTSVRREQSEPGDAACGTGERAASPVATSFTLSLSGRGREDRVVLVSVRWSRPGDQPCGLGPNTRTVELSATVDLAPGGTATLTGDGGLSVRLRRR